MRNPNFPETDGTGLSAAKDFSPNGAAPQPTGFLADIEDVLTSATSLTGEDLARAKAKLMERVETAKASVTKMSTAADGFVRERPWQVLGIAAVVCVVAGMLLARRR